MIGAAECVFNGGANCIHKCHQGIKLGAQENEEDVINKMFPKVD